MKNKVSVKIWAVILVLRAALPNLPAADAQQVSVGARFSANSAPPRHSLSSTFSPTTKIEPPCWEGLNLLGHIEDGLDPDGSIEVNVQLNLQRETPKTKE